MEKKMLRSVGVVFFIVFFGASLVAAEESSMDRAVQDSCMKAHQGLSGLSEKEKAEKQKRGDRARRFLMQRFAGITAGSVVCCPCFSTADKEAASEPQTSRPVVRVDGEKKPLLSDQGPSKSFGDFNSSESRKGGSTEGASLLVEDDEGWVVTEKE